MDTRHPSAPRRRAPGTSRTTWRATAVVPSRGQPANARGLGVDLSTVVLTDVSGSARRDQQGQRRMRQDLDEIVREVVRYVGLDLDLLPTTDTGDGIRLLFP